MARQNKEFEHPIIDVDVHQRWRQPEELLDRLPGRWREYAQGRTGGKAAAFMPAGLTYPVQRGVNKRLEAVPEDGKGTSFQLMKEQYLDRYPTVEAVNLTFDIGQDVAQRNPEYSAALSCAMNDWVAETWLTYDHRMRTAIVVPTELPDRAADEIHRMAPNPKVTGVLIAWNPFGKPLGHPVYDPIWRACEAEGLPVILHGAAGETEGGLAHTSAGGLPGSRLEWHTLLQQPTLSHLASFVVHGTFEKFPKLKVMVVETGLAWIPNFFWRLDKYLPEMRAESAWVQQRPSDYIRQHVKFSTQPFELTPHKEQLVELFEAVGGMEDLLCFSSDYPHWDADDPFYVASRLPESWLPKIFSKNAKEMLRLLPISNKEELA